MKFSWIIRAANVEDSRGLAQCMELAYTAYQQRMDGARLPPMDVDYVQEIVNYPTWVVESAGKVVGGLIMSFDNDQAWIANIAVDPECQGQGIGAALLELAETQARERSFFELHLATHVLLHENVSLYKHLGWQETGTDDKKILMQKKL